MKTYKVNFMEIATYPHANPERTGYRLATRDIFCSDLICKVWPNRASLKKTIDMQERREHDTLDWRMVQK